MAAGTADHGVDLECFLVTKHSWKGKYKRILSIGSVGVSTYNPDKFDPTNRWLYGEVISVLPNRSGNTAYEFVLNLRKDKKIDTIKLSSENRNEILTSLLKYHKEFAEKPKQASKFNAYKHHWSGTTLPTVLEVTPCSLDQLDPTTNTVLASYNYKDIDGIIGIQDYKNGIVLAYGGHSRLHLFRVENNHDIVQMIVQNAQQYLAIDIKVLKKQITLEQFEQQRFGAYSGDQHQTSMSEFTVLKVTPRHSEPMRRILCLTDTTVLERDPQTYSICTLRPLDNVYALVRHADNIQQFSIEYKNGLVRSYITNDRDSLLATLLDAVRSCGNQDVHVRISNTPRGKRVGPLTVSVDEETEANLLRYIISCYQYPVKRIDVMERFNANIPYSGLNYSVTQDSLFAESKERLITGALQALISGSKEDNALLTNVELEASFHVLRRLLASKAGFAAFTNLPGFREAIGLKVVHALKRNDLAVTYAAIDMINSLMHSDHDLKQEQLNKSSLLHTKAFLEQLLDMWSKHVNLGSGALVLSAMLDFLTFALCVPYSETTDGKQFDMLLEMVAARGRTLYKLFQHPSLAIVKGSGLVMRALIEEGDAAISSQMQTLALDEAALCRHLLVALYTPTNDSTMIAHRQLSRHLVGLWITDSPEAMNLLKRIFPAGLLAFLESEEAVPKEDVEEDRLNFRDNLKLAVQHSGNNTKRLNYLIEKHIEGIKHWGMNLLDVRQEKLQQAQKNRPIVLRNRRNQKKKAIGEQGAVNLPLFFYQFGKNHAMPNLIWNLKTREELRAALENELRQFTADKDLAGNMLVAWNYDEFEVQYACIADELKIGDYYIRLLLERDDWPSNLVKNPIELFNALYRRVLCRNRLNDDQLTVTSLKALAKVYKRYYEEIGYFSDMPYILQMLDRCLSPALRDALIILIKNLVLHKSNCRPLVDHVNYLVDLITLAHLHKGRATLNTKTNVIEAGPNMKLHEEKDWYYNVERGDSERPERCGPVTFSELRELWGKGVLTPRTRCWAVGMDGWRSLQQIPQLKWCLMAKGTPLFNETELAQHVLDILNQCTSFFPSRARDGEAVLIPGPRLSRKLSEFICLPHIVQVCLTHDPGLLERVATLLCQIMEDNPEMSKVYLTGVFYFMLMYTGSNILPIARFLKMTHMKQAFRSEDSGSQSGIMHRSILGQLLPEAMICFLENHSAEKFAETFLGEFDTPEVIWSSEMRRMLIEKISAHIADFTPKLKGHTMARYPYLAIPVISYPQLENELFCNIFYLRHLCDTTKFPNWPIPDPVQLLKHTLDAWRKEVEKKPSEMTVTQAYLDLEFDVSKNPHPEEAAIRKAYYKLAQMYHPDKNPNGREIFERVNRAYEFLCSRNALNTDGPNPSNIVLILRTQSILFERYSEELRPYKYAGYPQLIKTIRLETKDDQLFSKTVPLLSAASELCYHTVHCSALNAEELRREEGIEALLDAYSRCVSIMGVDSKRDALHYEVISNITRCFDVACCFDSCRRKILELPQLIVDVCRVVYFKHSLSVSLVTSLAVNNLELQCDLVRNGVLWSLMMFLFDYDYTLDESGVTSEEKSNQQQVANNLAKLSLLACVALAGYSMTLVDDPKAAVLKVTAKATGGGGGSVSPGSRSGSPQTAQVGRVPNQTYSQNASNLIQNNSSLIQSVAVIDRALQERKGSDVATADGEAAEPIECEKGLQNKKYKISNVQPPANGVVKNILDRLLTPYVAGKMVTDSEQEVLKMLNSNTRNPYLIWDNGTRAQLTDFLEHQRTNASKEQYEDVTQIYELVQGFSFDAHRDELKIGGIFIRVYNEMPTFTIVNPKSFVMDLLEFLKQGYNHLNGIVDGPASAAAAAASGAMSPQSSHPTAAILGGDILVPTKTWKPMVPPPKRPPAAVPGNDISAVLSEYARSKQRSQLGKAASIEASGAAPAQRYDFASDPHAIRHILMALQALISVLQSNANVEIQCIGHFEMLFGLLSTSQCGQENRAVKKLALEVVCLVSRNKECVTEIAACEIVGLYLIVLKDPDLSEHLARVLETLSGLLNAPKLIKEAHAKGAVIYLLDLFCNCNNPQIREQCAELLAKMNADKLSGPKVRITVCKYLPPVFLDAMIDSTSVAVQMFESIHEHPELIWNDDIRASVSDAVRDGADSFHAAQKRNARTAWRDPDILPELLSNELVVSGVYLRLYVSNPGWTLRKPKQFLADLLDFIVENISRAGVDKGVLDLATTALVLLLNAQPNLADSIPVLGHIPKFFRQLSVQPKSALTVLHQLSLSEICVSAISQTECIPSLKSCMEHHRDLTATACETLSRLFKCQHDSLIRQSLECQLIPYLLALLDSRFELATNPAMVKAQIVAALKAMSANLTYGDRVTHLLNQNPIWAEYRDQRHDLFITDTDVRGYLMGAPTTTAGYLTQGPTKNVEVLTSPPPIDRDDPLFARSNSSGGSV
ncbi:AGAP005771-PA-like protein [Anopheles sinensis]|uniref:AGAP005771-PA-like protein n=1 Tax=Anopheles sinensis TaxID=74873 RepID=A0A084WJP4_ANOSI|nr:AGAP005771-PA-like protein [Anopheles sinensis]